MKPQSALFTFLILVGSAVLIGHFLFREPEPREPWEPVPSAAHPSSAPSAGVELLGDNHTSPGCSALITVGFVDLPFGAMTLVALALAAIHRRRARAERAFDPAAKLRDGAAVIFGAVEVELGAETPVAVRIEQRGTEQRNGDTVGHWWKEIGRTVVAHPFHMRRDDGVRVRIEPDPGVVLHGDLLRTERLAHAQRVRVAELHAGDRVHVHGELVGAGLEQGRGAYRESATLPLLRAPRLGPMVISSEAPGDVEAQQARFHTQAAAALAVCFAFFSLVLAPSYQLLALDGRVLDARPTHTRTWQVWEQPKGSSGRWVREHALRAEVRMPDGTTQSVEDRCSREAFDCVREGRCKTVPFLVSSVAPSVHQIGSRPKLSRLAPLIIIFGLVLGIVYPALAFGSRPWYAQRRLDEGGSGPLASSEPEA